MTEDMTVTRNDLPALLKELYKKFPKHLHEEHAKKNYCYVYDAATHILTAYQILDRADASAKLIEVEADFHYNSKVWIFRDLAGRGTTLVEVFEAYVGILTEYREPLYLDLKSPVLVMRNRGDAFSIYAESKHKDSLF